MQPKVIGGWRSTQDRIHTLLMQYSVSMTWSEGIEDVNESARVWVRLSG